ncbi:MAG: hypothetical protein U1D55_07075 [Phycisphaerae bacterium]
MAFRRDAQGVPLALRESELVGFLRFFYELTGGLLLSIGISVLVVVFYAEHRVELSPPPHYINYFTDGTDPGYNLLTIALPFALGAGFDIALIWATLASLRRAGAARLAGVALVMIGLAALQLAVLVGCARAWAFFN